MSSDEIPEYILDKYDIIREVRMYVHVGLFLVHHPTSNDNVTVWSAYAKKWDTKVFLKQYRDAFCSADRAQVPFREIMTMTGSLGEHCCAQLLDVFASKQEEDVYIVYSSREHDFKHLMKSGMSGRKKLRAIYDLLRSVWHIHSQGIIHRNIVPGNILVGAEGDNIKLCNFEMARGVQPECMTPRSKSHYNQYQAPELLYKSTQYNGKVDIWAIGCIVAQLLRGGSPLFKGKDELQQLFEIADIIGYPSQKEIDRMSPDDSSCIEDLMMHHPRKSIQHETLDAFFPRGTPIEAIDFVERCLKFNHEKRATIDDLLSHPLFKCVRVPKLIPGQTQLVPTGAMNTKATVKYYRDYIISEGVECKTYRMTKKVKPVTLTKPHPTPSYAMATNASRARLDQTLLPKPNQHAPWIPTAKPILPSVTKVRTVLGPVNGRTVRTTFKANK